jgi:hypothetical protein
MHAFNSHRAMTFESNFNIQAASRHSQQGPSELCLPSDRASSRASSHRSSERKCSIFNELSRECVELAEKRKISRFMQQKKNREDHIKEEYFDEPPPRRSKRVSPRDSMR